MSLQFCSIASGSRGNCYLVKAGEYVLLIDAGIQGDIQVSLDGERTQPVICYGMMNIKAAPGSHSLHIFRASATVPAVLIILKPS